MTAALELANVSQEFGGGSPWLDRLLHRERRVEKAVRSVSLSIEKGEVLARRMAGGAKPGDALFDDPNWPAVPGHFGPPWFLPFIGVDHLFLDWRQ